MKKKKENWLSRTVVQIIDTSIVSSPGKSEFGSVFSIHVKCSNNRNKNNHNKNDKNTSTSIEIYFSVENE